MLNVDYQGKGYAFEAAHAFFDYLFSKKGARRIYAYVENYNLSSQHLCEKLGMRREGLFMEFVSFINNPNGTPRYENTCQYAILKKEWHWQLPVCLANLSFAGIASIRFCYPKSKIISDDCVFLNVKLIIFLPICFHAWVTDFGSLPVEWPHGEVVILLLSEHQPLLKIFKEI